MTVVLADAGGCRTFTETKRKPGSRMAIPLGEIDAIESLLYNKSSKGAGARSASFLISKVTKNSRWSRSWPYVSKKKGGVW